ncbi:hypothetical protein M6D81_02945 [Paenibacillus sp. J5C_2022]|uniref:hypothetical protein n=1 Tax=Paenibacillus sp. J5C2022 TaxID=2977129 RepID=UPI0021D068CF|nr:hypothetical protein [Paenibacillus sp. J5C2022]MCU6707656.1 hypothetical protein [Paenibacillus sp. J5C2022]
MSGIQITAAFVNDSTAHEAARKLQALRALEVGELQKDGMLTAMVDDSVAERAMHLIQQIGGNIQSME